RFLVSRLPPLAAWRTPTPALRAGRSSFPNAHIGLLTTHAGAAAVRGLDSFDEVLVFDKYAFDQPTRAAGNLSDALGLARDLRRGDWDTLVLLHHLTTRFGIAKYAA